MIVRIPVTNKEYELIDTLTKKEVKEYANLMMPFIGFEDRLSAANEEERKQMVEDIQKKAPETDALWFAWFNRCIKNGIDKKYFEEDMRNIEAIMLFSAIWKASTELPLELSTRSNSRSTTNSTKTLTS